MDQRSAYVQEQLPSVVKRSRIDQPISEQDARYLELSPSERVAEKRAQFSFLINQLGYGNEPPELSPDGLTIEARQKQIEARQKQIDDYKAKSPSFVPTMAPLGAMPGVLPRSESILEDAENRQALHINRINQWRADLITPQNVDEKALKAANTYESYVDQAISNRGFQSWAWDVHHAKVGDPTELINGRSYLTDPATRALAGQWLLTQPGSGDRLWDFAARFKKGAVTNAAGGVAGGLGVAFTAVGAADFGQSLSDIAEASQLDARNNTDPRLDGTAPAMIGEAAGELAFYTLTGSAVASLGRAAGWGQRGINIATTVANGTQGGFTNSYTLYQQAKAYGASEQQARCAAGWGFLAGTTTAIPVTQWSLRLERGAEVFAPISRMTLEAAEAGGQGLVLGVGNEVIAQQIYDKNRDVLEGIVGDTALNSGAAGIVSFLTSVVARAKKAKFGGEVGDVGTKIEPPSNEGLPPPKDPSTAAGPLGQGPDYGGATNPYRNADGSLILPDGGSDDPALREYSAKLRAIANDQEFADASYDKIPDARGGKVLGTDIARELLPEYAIDREGKIRFVGATGDVAHYYAKDRFWREINNRGDRKTLLFTAGGVAAGKSSAIKDSTIKEFDLVFDGTMRDPVWATEMISMAVKNGWNVRVDYVQRPIDLVMAGAVFRANKLGRWGPVADLPAIHESAQESIIKIAGNFENNPSVEMHYWLNDGLTMDIPAKKLTLAEIDKGGKYSYFENYGLDKRTIGQNKRRDGRGLEGDSGPIPERRRRAAEAFRGAVESRKYETRILRLLVKGSPEYEQILDTALMKIGDPY